MNNTPGKTGRATASARQRRSAAPKGRSRSGFVKPRDIIRVRGGVDRPMMIIIIALLCFGLVMVFSSSFASALKEKHDSFYYIKRQAIFAVLGVTAMIVVSLFDYRIFRKLSTPAFLIALVLLALVPIMGLAEGVATRWIKLGPIRFQPSEPMKLVLVLFLAHYFATHQDKITDYRDFKQSSVWGNAIPIAIVGFVCFLILLENHFSGLIIMFIIGMIVIFAGGARVFWFAVSGGAISVAVLIFILFTDYARKRLDIFLHPENYSSLDETFQTLQGLNAIGSGGLLGVGHGNGSQKYGYVPEPQNDFIFSIVCEELGFVGAVAIIALFMLFVWRGFVIAMRAPDTFSSLTVIGIVGKVAIQAILNIAVVTSLIPNTGIPLPFFSYGGSSLFLLLVEMGVVLAISRYSYKEN